MSELRPQRAAAVADFFDAGAVERRAKKYSAAGERKEG